MSLIPDDKEKPCHLADLPNELILLILKYGIDNYMNSIEPISINENTLDETSGSMVNFLSFWRNPKANTAEALAKKRLKTLNANLSIAACKAISAYSKCYAR